MDCCLLKSEPLWEEWDGVEANLGFAEEKPFSYGKKLLFTGYKDIQYEDFMQHAIFHSSIISFKVSVNHDNVLTPSRMECFNSEQCDAHLPVRISADLLLVWFQVETIAPHLEVERIRECGPGGGMQEQSIFYTAGLRFQEKRSPVQVT
ncbi:hypothetical protein STEG23_000834, partial [Scotinomys teguina]